MFPVFLFAVAFSFLSWLQYDPQHSFYQHQSDKSAVVVPPVAAANLPILESLPKVPEPPLSMLIFQDETNLELELKELLLGVDINKLQLRPARKIAKVLGIAQKINGRDQTLSFLRSQIKAKLQQFQELPPETAKIVQELLVS